MIEYRKTPLRPQHYFGTNGIEVLDVIDGFVPIGRSPQEIIYWFNVVKYILRYRKTKNPLLSLQKA